MVSYSLIFTWYSSSDGNLGLTSFGLYLFSIFQILIALAITLHFRCMLSEPGATPFYEVPGDIPLELIKYCNECEQWKPPRTHHCRACKLCFHKYDHHCPWVNNCIAVNNQKFFILFLLYTTAASILTLIIIGMSVYEYFKCQEDVTFDPIKLIFTAIVGILAAFFIFFLGGLLIEHISLAAKNQTTVESQQDMYGTPYSLLKCFSLVFGRNYWAWLLPLSSSIDINYLEPIYSYDERKRLISKDD
ncbi:unnamed protein product [Blepharisma stoltei]|uniref:Palmitoyltransferase n=1 Tax=Blepharisma stoltei TaxID=1481888 RepID=A0AAU9JVI9_9CILI|nr:unnamed protein product [Blepharisma stoltei]